MSKIRKYFKQYLSLDSFHKSKIPFKAVMLLMALFSVIFIVIFTTLKVINKTYGITFNSTAELIEFLCLEFFPMLFLCGFMGIKYHYVKSHYSLAKKFFLHIWSWIKIFWYDIRHHIIFIIFGVLICMVLQEIINGILPQILGQSMATSQNTKTIAHLGESNKWFLLSTIIIAPLAEEFFFRLCGTTAFEHLFGFFGKIFVFCYHIGTGQRVKLFQAPLNKYYIKICYILGVLVSAFIFGALHDPMDPSVFLMLGYMSMACLFQFLMHKTQSLTTSVMVHGASNLLIVLPILL